MRGVLSPRMILPIRALALASLSTLFATAVFARLGENEAQSQTRYGTQHPELSGPGDKPLLPGAREIVYDFNGYRIRAAFVNGVTVRIEYLHLPENGALKPLTEPELKAILEGEKGAFAWREEKPRTGNAGLNALETMAEGRKWERSDHARATLKLNLVLELEAKDAELLAKKLAKSPGSGAKATPANLPKF